MYDFHAEEGDAQEKPPRQWTGLLLRASGKQHHKPNKKKLKIL